MNITTRECGCRVHAGQIVQHCVLHLGQVIESRATGKRYSHIAFDATRETIDATRDALDLYIKNGMLSETDPIWTGLMNIRNLCMCAAQIEDEKIEAVKQRATNEDLL